MRTVLCIEDDVLRAGLRSMLERHHPVTVVADCDNAGDAIHATQRLRPDVTVLGVTGVSAEPLPPMEDVVRLVVLVEGSYSTEAAREAPARAIIPMPRTDQDVAHLADLIQNEQRDPVRLPPEMPAAPERARCIRMLLLDNHPTVRLAIETLVRPYENIEVAGSCSSVDEAMEVLTSHPVDILVMELEVLGIVEWESFCAKVRRCERATKIFVYSSKNFPDYVATAIRAGVDSFVHKGFDCARLMDAIHRTCVGERVWLVGADSQEVVSDYEALTRSAQLTNRERQIIVPLLHRRSNDEIATELCLAIQTVKNHVSNILRKVGVRNRRELFQRLGAHHRPR